MLSRKRTIAAAVLLIAILGGVHAYHLLAAEQKAPAESRPDDPINIPSQTDGIVLVLGTEIKDGDKVPANEVITVKIDGQDRRYRRLKVGDKVEEGQVIGRVDDRLARFEVEACTAHLKAAEERRKISELVRDEAMVRIRILRELCTKTPGSVSPEEMRGAETLVSTSTTEQILRAGEVKLAEVNVKKAELLLSQYEIRAVRGEVTAILKRRGEAVRAYETVVRIRAESIQ